MLAPLTLCLLAAAPTPPRVHPAADAWAWAPRLDALSGLGDFSRAAGRATPLLRSDVFSEELLPLLQLDITDRDALARAGVDTSGPLSASALPAGRVACLSLSDASAFQARAEAALRAEGPRWPGTLPGVTVAAALRGGEPSVGYVLRGKLACVASAPRAGGEALLKSVAKLLSSSTPPSGWADARSLPGDFFLGTRAGAVAAVRASASGLTAEGRMAALPGNFPSPLGPGPSPYGTLQRTGAGLLRARLDPRSAAGVARGLAELLARACSGCDGRAAAQAADALAPLLTGHVALHVEGFRLRPPPRSQAARFFALRHGWAAEVKDAPAAARALAALASARGFKSAGGGVVLSTPEGEVQLGLSGNHLYAANDGPARQSLLSLLATARPAPLDHGLAAELDTPVLGKALSGVSVLDALGNTEAAGLFALALEAGPFLRLSGPASATADKASSGVRFHAEWPLPKR